ncbi:MAG: hypothetical protein ACXWJU_03105 [Hyphomicrobium sp.]
MPQVVAAVLIGAGIAAGFKWIAREMARAVDDACGAHNDQPTRNVAAPKDLGALEWDAKSGVYRPAGKRSSV